MLGLRTLVGTGLWSTVFKGIFSEKFFPDTVSYSSTIDSEGFKGGKTTAIRRVAVRETGVSRQHGGPIEGAPATPRID